MVIFLGPLSLSTQCTGLCFAATGGWNTYFDQLTSNASKRRFAFPFGSQSQQQRTPTMPTFGHAETATVLTCQLPTARSMRRHDRQFQDAVQPRFYFRQRGPDVRCAA
jgi:hypothetical protein